MSRVEELTQLNPDEHPANTVPQILELIGAKKLEALQTIDGKVQEALARLDKGISDALLRAMQRQAGGRTEEELAGIQQGSGGAGKHR